MLSRMTLHLVCADTMYSVNHKEVTDEKLLRVSKRATYELPEVDWCY